MDPTLEDSSQSDVYISCSPEDHALVQALADALKTRVGWSVSWDKDLEPGEGGDSVSSERIGSAACVLVVWSGISMASDRVRSEAMEAFRRGVLVSVSVGGSTAPPEFAALDTLDLSRWQGDANAGEVEDLVVLISERLYPRAPNHPAPGSEQPSTKSPESAAGLEPDLPEALRAEIAARAAAQAVRDRPAARPNSALGTAPDAPQTSAPPRPRGAWSSRQGSVFGVLLRYAFMAGGLLLLGWLGVKAVPVIFGMTSSSKPRRPEDDPAETLARVWASTLQRQADLSDAVGGEGVGFMRSLLHGLTETFPCSPSPGRANRAQQSITASLTSIHSWRSR